MAVLHQWQIIFFAFISIFGFIGNLTVCLVMITGGWKLRSVPFNVYITSLAVTDLSLAVIGIPIYVSSKSSFNHPSGLRGDLLCKFVTGNLIPFWLAGSSVYLLVLISFERYYTIRDPFLARTRTTSLKTFTAILGAMMTGLIVQIPVLAGIEYAGENATIGNYCGYKWKDERTTIAIYLSSLTFQYLVPAAIFVFNFLRIRKCLTTLDEVLRHQSANQGAVKQKRRTIKTVLIVVIAFFICWTPNTVMFFVFQYTGASLLAANSDVFEVSVVLAFSSAWINPILYSFRSSEFRKHCKHLFSRIFRFIFRKICNNTTF